MTLAPPLCPPRGVVDPVGVARREAALLQVVRAHPGATLSEITEIVEGRRGAVIDRLKRLAARGAVERVAGRWRIVGEEDEPEPIASKPELQPIKPEPEPGAQSRWVKSLACYERKETTVVEGLRYG
jgi:hypothetical protein